jgi:hypothetical protein
LRRPHDADRMVISPGRSSGAREPCPPFTSGLGGYKRDRHRSVLSKCPSWSSSGPDRAATLMLEVASYLRVEVSTLLLLVSRSEGIDLDAADGAARLLHVDQFPELQRDSSSTCFQDWVIVARLSGPRQYLRQLDPDVLMRCRNHQLVSCGRKGCAPTLNDSVGRTKTARLASYPV